MEFEIKWQGQRLGVVKFEVDSSVYLPILQKLGFFGINFNPLNQTPPK